VAHILQIAETQYNDWTGTSAADDAESINRIGLDKVIGLDPERWWVLSVEIYAAEPADLEKDCVTVYALDRDKFKLHSAADLDEYARAHGGALPVTSFVVKDVAASRIVLESFKRFAVQLRSKHAGEWDLNVEAEDWLNDTDS
jgi:hypothetical protein